MASTLQAARYAGELELRSRIEADEDLRHQLQRTEVLRRRSLLRTRMLGEAVRIDRRLQPSLADSVERLSEHLGTEKLVEAYVFADPGINAFVAEGSKRLIIAVSSGAVNTLTASELDFILGHEAGHAVHGHLDICVEAVVELGNVSTEQCRLLRAWQRAAEITADRAGLLSSGSLEVAANALFKTLSGLSLPGVQVDPDEFAEQWTHLASEILDYGGRELWQLSHPFPPLRMQAMRLFWRSARDGRCDAEIARLLGMMENGAGSVAGGDPLLARFAFWGGLYVALADGPANGLECEHLLGLMPPGLDFEQVLAETVQQAPLCLERFSEARQSRQTKLSSSELHRIVQGLVAAASVDGPLNPAERTHLHNLGQALGLRAEALDLVVERHTGGN